MECFDISVVFKLIESDFKSGGKLATFYLAGNEDLRVVLELLLLLFLLFRPLLIPHTACMQGYADACLWQPLHPVLAVWDEEIRESEQLRRK